MKKIVVWIYFVSIFLLLIYTTSPSVNSGDSGEFITTSVTLGIAHSPGYPLYSLTGKIFSFIIPFGNYAYRLNVMNVILTLIILYVLYLFFKKEIFLKYIIFIFLTGILIFSDPFWRHAVQTEVFIMNTLFVVLLTFILFSNINLIKKWCLVSFLSGMGLGNHHTLVLIFPGILFLFLSERKKLISHIPKFVLFFLLGIGIYSILPLRSEKNPGLDWGNTEKIKNLYRVFMRKDYGTFQLTVDKPLPRDIATISKQVQRYVKFTLKDLTFPVVIMVLWSLINLYFFQRETFFFFLLNTLSSGVGFFILGNVPFEPIYNGILERFYILPNTVLILSLSFAVKNIKSKLLTLLLTPILCFSFMFNVIKNFKLCNHRTYFLNYDYGMNILKTIAPNAILFMDGGDDTFYTLAYFQFAEHRRKDISLHDRGGLVFKNIYGDDFRTLTKEEKEKRRRKIESSFVPIRAVYYSTFNRNILPGYTLLPAGILYVVENEKLKKIEPNLFYEIYSLKSIYQEYYDYRSNALVPVYYFMFGLTTDDIKEKIKYLKYSFFLWPEVDWLKNNVPTELHNLGYKLFTENQFNIAEDVYLSLIKINPKDTYALLNLGVVYERLNKKTLAEELYKKVIELDKTNVTAYYNLAVLYWHKNDWDNVIKYFNKVLELQPDNISARNFLHRAEMFKKSNL